MKRFVEGGCGDSSYRPTEEFTVNRDEISRRVSCPSNVATMHSPTGNEFLRWAPNDAADM